MTKISCRKGCGACCIAPSISSSIPGMPSGKPAGVLCINLSEDFLCKIYDDPKRPMVCRSYQASEEFCGRNRAEALELLALLDVPIVGPTGP